MSWRFSLTWLVEFIVCNRCWLLYNGVWLVPVSCNGWLSPGALITLHCNRVYLMTLQFSPSILSFIRKSILIPQTRQVRRDGAWYDDAASCVSLQSLCTPGRAATHTNTCMGLMVESATVTPVCQSVCTLTRTHTHTRENQITLRFSPSQQIMCGYIISLLFLFVNSALCSVTSWPPICSSPSLRCGRWM